MGEKVFWAATVDVTANERHSADGEGGCWRVQGCLFRCGLVWSCLGRTRMAGEFELREELGLDGVERRL